MISLSFLEYVILNCSLVSYSTQVRTLKDRNPEGEIGRADRASTRAQRRRLERGELDEEEEAGELRQ